MPSALGLSTYRWNNNIKSIVLLGLFPFLLLALLGGIFYVYGLAFLEPNGSVNPQILRSFHITPSAGPYRPQDFALAIVYDYWPIVMGVAAVWVMIGFLFNNAMIRAATGAKAVTRSEQPKLYNLLENLCISRGIKPPNLYVIDSPQLNAYASGIDNKTYAITVTRGLLEKLDAKEMEAVLGHELTHILNRDCRLLIVTIVFVGMISFLSQMLWRSLRYVSYGRDRKPGPALVFMLIAAVASGVGYILALILRFAISRKREYLADAGSVELTKDPSALISALRKISDNPAMMDVPTEVRQMFIENPPSSFSGLFDTHPSLEDRILVLEDLGGQDLSAPPQGKSIIPPSA